MTNKIIKCDTVLCHKNSTYILSLNSYKGDIFLCEECMQNLKNIFKKDSVKNGKK